MMLRLGFFTQTLSLKTLVKYKKRSEDYEIKANQGLIICQEQLYYDTFIFPVNLFYQGRLS